MLFNTKYERTEFPGEVNSGEIIVETAGYVPAQKQIENLILSGQRLNEFRREQFHFGTDEEVDDTYTDYVNSPDFDPADASQVAQDLKQRWSETKKAIDEKQKKEAEESKVKESKQVDETE